MASDNLISQIKDKEDPQETPHSPLGSMPGNLGLVNLKACLCFCVYLEERPFRSSREGALLPPLNLGPASSSLSTGELEQAGDLTLEWIQSPWGRAKEASLEKVDLDRATDDDGQSPTSTCRLGLQIPQSA